MNQNNPNNIYHKLALIQNEAQDLAKSKYNTFQKYKYFDEYATLTKIKPLLNKQKLTLTFDDVPTDFNVEKTEKEWVIKYRKRAILTNAENPSEQLTFHFWAMGQNTDIAKAKGSAETYAIKYFLTKFFLIPITDNLDPDAKQPNRQTNLNAK